LSRTPRRAIVRAMRKRAALATALSLATLALTGALASCGTRTELLGGETAPAAAVSGIDVLARGGPIFSGAPLREVGPN
jgi:hypothetical protein